MYLIIFLAIVFAFVIFPSVLFGGIILTDFDDDLIGDIALMQSFDYASDHGELLSMCEDCNGPNDPVDICILCNPKVDCLKILVSGGSADK